MYLLGIDIGTSGTKSLLIDERGHVVAKTTIEYPLYYPKVGWAEQDPQDWWRATVESTRKVLEKADVRGEEVGAVGFSGQMHGSVFLDHNHQVIRPPILWCDVRTTEACRLITELAGGTEKLVDMVYNPALEGFTAPKIVWLQSHEPENYERVAYIVLPKDYIRYRLTGVIATDHSDAAGTLLFDVGEEKWSKRLLERLGIDPDLMPPSYPSPEVTGRLTKAAAEATGLKAGTPVVGGGADNACGAVGAGVVKSGRSLLSIGSSGVLLSHSDRAEKDPQGRAHMFNHGVPGKWYAMGVMLAAGLSLRWWRDQFAQTEKTMESLTAEDAYGLMTKQAANAPAGSGGLLFLPYLNGERTPHADADARGVLFGLSGSHGRAHVFRAVLEGVAFAMRDSLEIFKEMDIEMDQARAIGGGAKSPLWRQILADVLDVELATLSVDEGPAMGAALLAGVGAGVWKDVVEAAESTIRIEATTEPNRRDASIYDELYQEYQDLYPALQRRFKSMSKVMSRISG